MKHQLICKELELSYGTYTKLRNKYRFFSYITDVLALDYVLNLDYDFTQSMLVDLRSILANRNVLHGLDLALFGKLNCFNSDNLLYLKYLTPAVSRYQTHRWNYGDSLDWGDNGDNL